MKKKYYGILLAAVIAAGTIGVTAQAAELADTEKLTETANVTDDVNTANSTDASVQAQSDELEVPLVLNQTYTRSFSQVGQKYYFTFTPEETGYYYVDLNFPENMNIHVLDDYSSDALYFAEKLNNTESYTFCLELQDSVDGQVQGTGTITFRKAPDIKNVILQKANARDVFYNADFETISPDGAKLTVEYENGTKTYSFDWDNGTAYSLTDDYKYVFNVMFLDANGNDISNVVNNPGMAGAKGNYQVRVSLKTLSMNSDNGEKEKLTGTGYPITIRDLSLNSSNKLDMKKSYPSLKYTDGETAYYWFTPDKSGAYYVSVTGYGADYWQKSCWFRVYEKTVSGYQSKGMAIGTLNCKLEKGKQYILTADHYGKSSVFGACFAKVDTYVPLEVAQTPYVELNVKSDVTVPLKVKSSYKIKTIRMPSTDRIVSYESSDTKTATVSKNGTIKGKKIGTAKITVTLASGYSTSFNVKVQKKKVATKKITVDKKKITLKKKKSYKIKAELQPITASDKVTFTSSNKKVATVNAKGVVKAKKAGTAKITVKAGKKKAIVTVKVK